MHDDVRSTTIKMQLDLLNICSNIDVHITTGQLQCKHPQLAQSIHVWNMLAAMPHCVPQLDYTH